MEIEKIFDAAFWEDMWARAGEGRRKKKRIKSDEGSPWNRRADHFARKTGGDEGRERTKAVLDFLESEGIWNSKIKLIDVGCGPGTITIPLTRKAEVVYALDPSEKMLEILQERAAAEGIDNLEIINERWQDIDLKQKGWVREFDLSFASMSPGISGPGDLEKLIESSRQYCYLSTFAGRKDRAREDVWKEVVGEPPVAGEMDIIYPLNLLYAWGYRPNLRFFKYHRFEWLDKDRVQEELQQYLYMAADIGEEAEEKVRSYVESRLVNGLFPYEREHFQGMLLWDINELFDTDAVRRE